MKLRVVSLSLLIMCLAALPAMADTLYSNGPINGTTDGWTINFGFIVSNEIVDPCIFANCWVDGLQFGAWVFPGDVLQSAEVSITSAEFGGTTFFDQVVNFTQSGCSGNQYGFNVCTETGSWDTITLAQGTYWLNLQNATVNTGDPIYWDENSGPSRASENSVGTIPSEAFTLLGTQTQSTSTTATTGTVPEPSSFMLFGSGILALTGVLRRRLY